MREDASQKTNHFVQDWLNKQKRVDDLKEMVRNAETDERNAHAELAKYLAPADIREGETIGIWVNYEGKDRLITVTKRGDEFVIGWRPEKK